jgi:hypothetical protein
MTKPVDPSYALRRTDLPVLSSPLAKNILLRELVETAIEGLPSRTRSEGRFAIVTDVGCGMRWTQERRMTSDIHADGEVVWS